MENKHEFARFRELSGTLKTSPTRFNRSIPNFPNGAGINTLPRNSGGKMKDLIFWSIVLYFNLNNDTSLFNHSLFVLAEAIRLDNEELRLSLLSTKEYTKEETIIAYNWMINNSHKFETLKSTSYKRVQDDNDGDQDSAIEIVINNEMIELHCNCGDSFRFRTSCGGGKSLRVRNALIYLAYVAENKL